MCMGVYIHTKKKSLKLYAKILSMVLSDGKYVLFCSFVLSCTFFLQIIHNIFVIRKTTIKSKQQWLF